MSQEEFYNLQSKHRGKKTFNFYDKFVPQPFKITPSPTPTISPTVTPTITPTPSASLPPCSLYQSFCFYASDALSYINGIYNRLPGKSGSVNLTNISGTTYEGEIDCSSNYAIYTGTTAALTTGVWMFDNSNNFIHFELLSGNFACTPFLFEVKYQLVEYPTPTTFTCDGIIYPDQSDLQGYITYGGVCPTPTPTPTPSASPINANGFKLTNSTVEGGDMNGIYILANPGYYDEFAGSSGGLSYQGWACINPAIFVPPYGNLYKNINDDEKFINVESFNGGNIVRLRKGGLTSQIPSDPNNPFSCNTRLFDVSKDYGYNYTGSATTYCSLSFPVSGSTTFGDVEYLPCI